MALQALRVVFGLACPASTLARYTARSASIITLSRRQVHAARPARAKAVSVHPDDHLNNRAGPSNDRTTLSRPARSTSQRERELQTLNGVHSYLHGSRPFSGLLPDDSPLSLPTLDQFEPAPTPADETTRAILASADDVALSSDGKLSGSALEQSASLYKLALGASKQPGRLLSMLGSHIDWHMILPGHLDAALDALLRQPSRAKDSQTLRTAHDMALLAIQKQKMIPSDRTLDFLLASLMGSRQADSPASLSSFAVLRALEAQKVTPTLRQYALAIQSVLFSPSSAGAAATIESEFQTARLLAHPVPDARLFNLAIYACSLTKTSEPERALDLLIEMQELSIAPTRATYACAILACVKEGPQKWYYEGLRLMREMLSLGLAPDRLTYEALLQGTTKHKDLARARWIFLRMMQGAQAGDTSLTPDQYTLSTLLKTYATYRPPDRRAPGLKGGQPSAHVDIARELDFPGPLPRSSYDVIEEAHGLVQQTLGQFGHILSLAKYEDRPRSSESAGLATQSTSLRMADDLHNDIRASVLNALLAVHVYHSRFTTALRVFDELFDDLGVRKTHRTYTTIMARCRTGRDRALCANQATRIFNEWQQHCSDELAMGRSPAPNAIIVEMWRGKIDSEARDVRLDAAISSLRTFIKMYLDEETFKRTQQMPPILAFEDLELLRLRLIEDERPRGVALLRRTVETGARIQRAYERMLRSTRAVV
ncbi:uncharacterized protein L969DRAFT_42498 [Mixia osmundae IAM 14324]|uniref:Pentacotripeptide-repeat region of PRORP domain-containing protein n=1 Tax=Mixia osmundae (strain CBS 9802 / IAM 14324 / JCM 22182 / KY 12970) TaxID=764103 RepID=G7E2Y5_MIXOS|nr:uncharacterized protein L969DRAFT_42498 [Mixia osmundae IAM 14324]KEI42546.1 hypothetical protein L969DRAFT_42498 [Mixia osmundae IAM 14324]GAA97166.1 hypothetical protein E5Q_03842 [Mixia osmundae IAM 14324]